MKKKKKNRNIKAEKENENDAPLEIRKMVIDRFSFF